MSDRRRHDWKPGTQPPDDARIVLGWWADPYRFAVVHFARSGGTGLERIGLLGWSLPNVGLVMRPDWWCELPEPPRGEEK